MGKILVYIDGDNVHDANLVSKLYRKESKTECVYVVNNVMCIPKK